MARFPQSSNTYHRAEEKAVFTSEGACMPTDVYSSVVPFDVDDIAHWEFDVPLIVELEVKRGSGRVSDIHVNLDLPGLRKFLRSQLRGLPIAQIGWLDFDKGLGTYHATFWRNLEAGLVLAVRTLKECRYEEYLNSLDLIRPTTSANEPCRSDRPASSRRDQVQAHSRRLPGKVEIAA